MIRNENDYRDFNPEEPIRKGVQEVNFCKKLIFGEATLVKIEAFCVESGRWEKRGNEDAKEFTSSNDRIVTSDPKIAAGASSSQQEVWGKVSEAQARSFTDLIDSIQFRLIQNAGR